MPKLQKGKARVLMPEDFKLLLKVLASDKRNGKRDTLLIMMSFGLGLRVMELAALKVSDVLTENGKVKEELLLEKTKMLKRRILYIMDNRIKRAIADYIEERKIRAELKRNVFNHQQPLFLSQRGSYFTAKTLQKRFEHIYKITGLKGASSHSGRRTFATNLIENGTDIKAISTLMGHSDINMTARYVEDNPVRLKKIITKALF